MPLNYGRIGGRVLGACLVVSALQCPEIGLNITGYLADIFLGQFFFTLSGVVWLLAALAGIGLIAARPSACWLLYIASGYTLVPCVVLGDRLIPWASDFSFFPFVWLLGSCLEINHATITIATRVGNLLFVCLTVAVHASLVKDRCRRQVRSLTESRRAAIVVLLLSAGSIVLFVGAIVPPLCGSLLGAGIESLITGLLFFDTPLLIWGIPAFIVSCYRLWAIGRTRRRLQQDGRFVDADQSTAIITTEAAHSRLRFTRRSLCTVAIISVLFIAAAVAIWRDAIDPARYDRHFHEVVAWADRVVIRKGGFDCCGSVDNQEILFEVIDPAEISQLQEQIQLIDQKPGGGCLCCGYPGVDWYRDGRRIALTAVQHGRGLRWKRFPGDAYLTEGSQQSLRQWFIRHGMSEKALN